MRVESGERVYQEGVEDPTLILVESGELEAHSGGTLLGTIGPGELLGEMALFAGGTRSASVTARTPVDALVLDWDGHDELRRSEHPVASVLEREALSGLARRWRHVVDAIAARGGGEQVSVRGMGFSECVAAVMGMLRLTRAARPDRVRVLARSRLFAGVAVDVLAELAELLSVGVWAHGTEVFRRDDGGGVGVLVASGRVELQVGDAGARRRMAVVGPGEVAGIAPLAVAGATHVATGVVRRRLVALTISHDAFDALLGRSDLVGSAFRVAMIRALAEHLSRANQRLSAIEQDDAELARLARASGGAEW